MNVDKIINISGISLSAFLTATQVNQVFQIISLVLTCLSVLVVLLRNLYSWYKEATKDGKITADEIKEGVEIVEKGIEEIKGEIKNNEQN